MSTTTLAESLKTASAELLTEILREAEARLSAQLTSAIAADQRAMTFLGFLLTLVAFLIGASLAAITASTPSATIAAITVVGALGLMVAGVLAFLATRPINFEFVGNDPSSWEEDAKSNKPPHLALAEQCAFYDQMLKNNRRAMTASSKFLRWASIVAGVTVLACAIAAAAWVVGPGLIHNWH